MTLPPDLTEPRVVTVETVAGVTNTPIPTIQKMCRDGRLKCTGIDPEPQMRLWWSAASRALGARQAAAPPLAPHDALTWAPPRPGRWLPGGEQPQQMPLAAPGAPPGRDVVWPSDQSIRHADGP
jgi:hypothetical protein